MYNYSPQYSSAQEFNDYMVDNYVCQVSSRYSISLWNVYDNIRENFPRTNNAAEGYNYRISAIFPSHPHIYEFVRCLKDEHEFQHHKSEEVSGSS